MTCSDFGSIFTRDLLFENDFAACITCYRTAGWTGVGSAIIVPENMKETSEDE